MNIYAKPGDLVIVTEATKNNGHDYDKEQVQNLLELNKPYAVVKTDVHSFHTHVYLEGFALPFNSVNFEDFEVVSEEESKVCDHINKFIGINSMYAKCKDCGVLLKAVDGSWELLSDEDKASVYVIPEDTMKIDKPSAINLSVEEAAEKEYPVPIGHPNALMRPLRNSERNAFIKGANHILQSGEYVSLKSVENRLDIMMKHMASKITGGDKLNDALITNNLNLLSIVLEDIKNLKNNQ